MKKFLSMMMASTLALSMVACGGGDSGSTSTGTTGGTTGGDTTGGTTSNEDKVATSTAVSPDNDFVVGMQADITNLDPHIASNGVSNTIANSMYETLVTFSESKDIEIVGKLAKEWSVDEDNMTYTFILEEGITFHDGEPFNAEAVVANYQRGQDDPTLRIKSQTSTWETVEVVGDYELKIKLTEPNNTFLNKLTQIRIASPKAIEAGTLSKESAGTGAFILSDRVEGGYTTVTVNENYWAEGPTVDSLKFMVVPEEGARVAMLQTGEADLIYPMPAVQVASLEGDDSIIVNNLPSTTYRYATLNQGYTLDDGRQPFAEVAVRQAMNYAFDSNAYAQVVFQGYAKEPTSIFSESIQYFSEQTPYSIDVDKATALMAEAGYEDGFPVDIWVDNTTVEMQGAEFFKQQMAQINIEVNVLPMESTTIAEMTSQDQDSNEVEIWYVNWSSGSYEADGSMRSILHSDKFPSSGYNTAFFDNSEFDTLLDEALLLTDAEEIAAMYAEAQAIAWEEAPWVFLGNDNSINAQKTYVEGLTYKAGGEMVFTTIGLTQ